MPISYQFLQERPTSKVKYQVPWGLFLPLSKAHCPIHVEQPEQAILTFLYVFLGSPLLLLRVCAGPSLTSLHSLALTASFLQWGQDWSKLARVPRRRS